jgi:hypothetical protein
MGRPPSLNHTGPTERDHQTARTGRYVAGIGGQLRPQHFHHAPRHETQAVGFRNFEQEK